MDNDEQLGARILWLCMSLHFAYHDAEDTKLEGTRSVAAQTPATQVVTKTAAIAILSFGLLDAAWLYLSDYVLEENFLVVVANQRSPNPYFMRTSGCRLC